MNKKVLWSLLTAALCLTLVGCGEESTKNKKAEEKVAAQEKNLKEKASQSPEKTEGIEGTSEKEAVAAPVKEESAKEEQTQSSPAYANDNQDPELEPLEVRHEAFVSQGPIFEVKTQQELMLLMGNTKYLNITFYDNYCFAQTQQSYNMVHNQPELLKRIPDMIFVNVHIEQFPEIAKYYQVDSTPFTVLINKGNAVVGTPGYYTVDGLEKFMREHLDIKS
ncbi:YbbN family protein [Niallia taxi]|uniref:thioredoxin family protein n=1 Tax=Niallia taxi TaxID=2499688 RepID=UPI0015F74D8E|nr:thioredoxin family protein [Niallia taxi]